MQKHPEVQEVIDTYDSVLPVASAEQLSAVRRQVLARLDERPTAARRRLRVSLATTAVGALAVTAAVAAFIVPGADVRPGDAPAMTTVVATLDQLAVRSADARALPVPAGAFVYTRGREVSLTATSAITGAEALWYRSETVRESWASSTGLEPRRIVMTRGLNAVPLRAGDAAKLDASGLPWRRVQKVTLPDATKAAPAPAAQQVGVTEPTPAYLASLPTQPDRLLDALRRVAPTNTKWSAEQNVFQLVAVLVSSGDALLSPELRAGLYRALAKLPGVEQVAGQLDLAGRPALAIARTEGGVREEILISPRTSRVVGTKQVLVTAQDGLPAGTVLSRTTFDQKLVASVGAIR
ncbi:CU044_5270 family protein [Kribbella solani]|uniref:CU044_5270 family protein n=1 Tax=Kribbella solani TaxID=236067 RepID=A0A841DJQ1_9ACTN|nr:CU044_5270 family protein [Kribbella solani]MBB5977305.1 hypothetical protein [Kribbella solani]